ncbi:uncharacterized protein K452DRAFT_360682 [Aplosporella prunicola CBS 121167]|uniref:Uncharacterized protein n=1 Tax=Aplosporella prunicola CBS 121167 TaxID=1176127 RepID=A0A6A6B676_9PEZI|nr:uncharacterized protein K452DRAFT_360682 [Aplosporella prunicola CBS 121167]KAF2138913.1 hypothetical protein K452DRAFT_360682 [Aplosporella prunicola CBS 121167]
MAEMPQELSAAACGFARAVVRTYVADNRTRDALTVQETVRSRLDPHKPRHSIWSKEISASYRNAGDSEAVLRLHLESWELYVATLGPDSGVALDWARGAVYEYQQAGDGDAALQFHHRARNLLHPTTANYVAWSRQLIHMYQRQQMQAEALAVTEEVFQHLTPHDTGYRAWAAQLCEQYYVLGRNDMSILVCETTFAAISQCLQQHPNDNSWKFHARGARLALAKEYRRAGKPNRALAAEALCE